MTPQNIISQQMFDRPLQKLEGSLWLLQLRGQASMSEKVLVHPGHLEVEQIESEQVDFVILKTFHL